MSTLNKPNSSLQMLRSLPPFPPVAAKLMNLLRQENTNFSDAVELLKKDASMTIEVLRLANSASAGSRFPITTLLQALSTIGVNRIISLATTLCVGRLLKPVAKLPVMRRCWRHNLATALITQKRSAQHELDPEKAYTFGLLAGIGRLALLVSNPQLYTHLVSKAEMERMPLDVFEKELFGFDHREAGNWLVREWKLPEELATTVFSAAPPSFGPEADLSFLIRDASSEADKLGFSVLEYETVECKPDGQYYEIAEKVNQLEQELNV